MAQRFVVDTAKAQQMGERLISAARAVEGFPPPAQPSGPLGTGALQQALSQFERSMATAKQNLAEGLNTSSSGFAAVSSAANNLDQQKAQEAGTI
jgi:hypothetical protein